MPEVSIVIPAYNAERFIRQCIDSVLGQTLNDIEVIVVDDGSDDETRQIVESCSDTRLCIISREHENAGAARNAGMRMARGKYLYFLDADDFIAPDALEIMASAADRARADIVVCGSRFFDDVTRETSPIDFTMIDMPHDVVLHGASLPERPFQSFVGWPWDKLFLRSFTKDCNLTFQEQRSTNDALFVYMALAHARRMVCLDDVLVSHRTNNQGSLEHTRSKSWRNAISAAKAISKSISKGSFDDRVRKSFNNWLVHFSYWSMATLDSDALTPEVSQAFFNLLDSAEIELRDICSDEDAHYLELSKAEYESLRIAYTKLRKRNEDTLNRVYGELHSTCDELEAERKHSETMSLENERLQKEKRLLEEELGQVRQSTSFRLGHALVKPFAWIKPVARK